MHGATHCAEVKMVGHHYRLLAYGLLMVLFLVMVVLVDNMDCQCGSFVHGTISFLGKEGERGKKQNGYIILVLHLMQLPKVLLHPM